MDTRLFEEAVQHFLADPRRRPVPVETFLQPPFLRRDPNVLASVCLLLTGNEIDTGEFDTFIDRIMDSLRQSELNRQAAYAMDFKVLTLKHSTPRCVWWLQKYFRSVAVLRSNIPDKFNFYSRQASTPDEEPARDCTYGLKSAPNYHFFEVMPLLKQYNTTLLLETDCYLGPDWLHRLAQYTQHSGGFWISGATYSGLNARPFCDTITRHINGGVAMYATGHPGFQKFVAFCHKIAPKYFQVAPWMPYDCLLDQIIADHYEHDTLQRYTWQFIHSQYRATNLILNFSPERDRGLCPKKIFARTRYAVLHKKASIPGRLPVFLHFPKCGGTHFYERCMSANIRRITQQEYEQFPTMSVQLTDDHENIVLVALAAGPTLKAPPESDGATPVASTITVPLREFLQDVYRNNVKNIFGFRLTSNSDYEAHWSLVLRLATKVPTYLTMLRRPIDRYQSEFYYLRDVGEWEPTYGLYSGMTFEQYVRSDEMLDNWIVRRLNNIMHRGIEVTDLHLRRAIVMLEKCSVLGFIEESEAFIATCADNFGFVDPRRLPTDPFFNQNDVSAKLPVSEELRTYFSSVCKYDEQLYEHFWEQRQNGVVIRNQ